MGAKRRQRGDGSVYQDKNGQWWAKLPLGNGRTRRARCASRKDAEATLKQLRADRDEHHMDLRASQQPIKAWLEGWLTVKAQSVRPSTLEFYHRHCEYMIGHIGHIRLEALEPQHIRVMLLALQRDGLAPQSCAHVLSVLRNALGMAVRDRVVRENVAAHVDAPRIEPYEAYVLGYEEQASLLAAAQGERLEALMHLLIAFGPRRGEILALCWADYDRAAKVLHIRESKTAAGRRALPLTADLCARLEMHWQQQEERQILGPAWHEHGRIFASEVGTPIRARNLNHWFKRLLRKARLDKAIRPHDLRHTAITDWIAAGADPKAAQGLAGHSSPAVTMKIYAKSRNEQQREAVERAERRRKQGS